MKTEKIKWISYLDLERLTGLNKRDRERLKKNGTIKGKGKMYVYDSIPKEFFLNHQQNQTA